MVDPLWSLRNVRFGRSRLRLSVDQLEIPQGIVGVIGKSGAGKTSLLNLLVKFDVPEEGEITECSKRSSGMPVSWLPPDLGLWPDFTVVEHLSAVVPESANAEAVSILLNELDLTDLSAKKPSELSMGERARLAVARCLTTEAAVHVMDEPFVHVDPGRIDRYWDVVRRHLQAGESSLVFVTHSPAVVMREADHVICLEDGRIVWSGRPTELYHSPPNESLARLLGPVNWLESTSLWKDWEGPKRALRPEEALLESEEKSQLLLKETWLVGAHQETEIQHAETGESTRVYHRPNLRKLEKGTRVALRMVQMCLLMVSLLWLSGCRESGGNERPIQVHDVRTYSLPSEGAMLPAPRGMTFGPDGEIYVLDTVGRVVVFNQAGQEIHRWWMPEYDVGRPEGIWVLRDNRVAVADTHYNRIVFFSKTGELLGMFGEFGSGPGQFVYVNALTQDPDGFLYVTEYGGNDRVQKFTAEGEFVTMFGEMGTDDGQFQRPSGIVWDQGVVYVVDSINNRIQAFSDDGKFQKVVADAHTVGLYYPYDLAQGPDGSLYVAEYGAGRISRIATSGELLGRYGQEGRGSGEFWTPWGIAVSQKNKVAVADTGNRRVVELEL